MDLPSLAATLLIALPAWLPHGGQYLPPAPDPGTPDALKDVVAQPGLGPEIAFSASAWEWWFDFNQEALLRLRERLPLRAAAAGAGWEPVTDLDRSSLVLPALVAAARPKQPASPGIRRELNPRDVRAAAVLALGRLRSADAVPYIELVLDGDPDLFVRTQAVLALGFSESSAAVETLARLYGDRKESEEIRSYAAAGLGLIADAQALDVLAASLTEKALAAQGNQLRAATVFAAGLTGADGLADAIRKLSGTWLYEQEPSVRALAAVSLGRIADPAAAPFLLEQLSAGDNQVRRSAAAAIAALHATLDEPSVRRLIERYETDADAPTKYNLLRALGSVRHPVARSYLRAASRTATFEYRPHLAMGLALDGDAGNVEAILGMLAEEHAESPRAAFAVALGLLDANSAAPRLFTLIGEEKSPFLRGYLALALGLLAPPQAQLAERLEGWIRNESDVELMRSCMLGLGLLGERARIARLAADVGSMSGVMRQATVLHGLGLVGDRSTIPALLAILRDDSQLIYVRTYALQALGELSDPRALSPAWRLSSHVELHHEVGSLFELYQVL